MSAALPSFTLRQLAYFAAAADAGTIVEAARSLNVSSSAMSDAITELESLVGERLCTRRRAQGLTLTTAGTAFLGSARRVLAEAEDLALTLGDADGAPRGPIAIGCYPSLAPTVLPPLLQDFAAEYPGIALSTVEATQDQLSAALDAGSIDAAIVYDMLVPGDPPRIRLFDLHAHVILPADHRLAGRNRIALREVIDEDLILLDAPPSSEHTMSVFAAQGLTPRVAHRTASYELVRTLVARGLGYGVLVSEIANQQSYEGLPLVSVPLEPPVAPVAVELIWSADQPVSGRTRRLIAFAREHDWTVRAATGRARLR